MSGPEGGERIAVGDGHVVARVWEPPAPHATLVVHPATATPQRFYTGFAQFAAAEGFAVVTYDYRGTGQSGEPRDFPAVRMRDWIQEDVPAVAAWARARYPGLPATAVGHSLGGHALAIGYGLAGVDRFALVASHLGVTRTIPALGERARVWTILHAVGPMLSRTMGYVPGRRLGLGEDMPGAVMLEWGDWARRPGYFFDDPTMQAADRAVAVRARVLAVGTSDDPWATPGQIDALTSRMTGATVQRRTITPAELGLDRIGHHGLMRRGVGEPLWADLVECFART